MRDLFWLVFFFAVISCAMGMPSKGDASHGPQIYDESGEPIRPKRGGRNNHSLDQLKAIRQSVRFPVSKEENVVGVGDRGTSKGRHKQVDRKPPQRRHVKTEGMAKVMLSRKEFRNWAYEQDMTEGEAEAVMRHAERRYSGKDHAWKTEEALLRRKVLIEQKRAHLHRK
jgi:hypothetical protein